MPIECVAPAAMPVRHFLWPEAHHEAELESKGKEGREGVLVFIHILVQLWQHLHEDSSISL